MNVHKIIINKIQDLVKSVYGNQTIFLRSCKLLEIE